MLSLTAAISPCWIFSTVADSAASVNADNSALRSTSMLATIELIAIRSLVALWRPVITDVIEDTEDIAALAISIVVTSSGVGLTPNGYWNKNLWVNGSLLIGSVEFSFPTIVLVPIL